MPDESRHYHHLNNHADVQSFGMTAHRYLVEQRIDVAKTLLLHTNQTGLEIALESGFKDCRFAKYLAYILLIIWHTPGCGRAFRHTASVA